MGKRIDPMLMSLDGYVEDKHGRFGWGAPENQAAHSYISQLVWPVGTYLYGPKMHETMVQRETAHTVPNQPKFVLDWARLWHPGGGGVCNVEIRACRKTESDVVCGHPYCPREASDHVTFC